MIMALKDTNTIILLKLLLKKVMRMLVIRILKLLQTVSLLMLLITILVYVLVPFSSLCLHHYSVYLVPSSSIALALMHLVVFDTGF